MRKVGSTAEDAIDVRIVSATHRILEPWCNPGTSGRTCFTV